MSVIITIRIPEHMRTEMKKSRVNWSEDIRRYIESRIKSFELHQVLKKIKKDTVRIKVEGDSTEMIRADRDTR